jgi:thiamine-monophosphate kinase
MAGPRSAPISERLFHAWLARTTRRDKFNRMPVGDDVAALSLGPPDAGLIALTTDAFAEGTHFRPRDPPRALGRALVEANLSDLASKGAVPIGFLLALLVPRDQPIGWCESVVRGVRDALRPYAVELSGGDTKWAPSPQLVGTAVGYLAPGPIPRRDGAKPGDILLTTGVVGHGAAAELPGRSRRGTGSGSEESLHIRARIEAGLALRPLAHAMIDTSDGLCEAGHLLAEASGVAIELTGEQLPWDPKLARAIPKPATRLALAAYGGDYELLATVPRSKVEKALEAVRSTRCPATVIGKVARGRGVSVSWGRRRFPVPRSTWDPFHPTRPGSRAR